MFNQYTYQVMGTINRHTERLGDNVRDMNNLFTPGYKRKETHFHETMNGMKARSRRLHTTGIPKKTGRELDFAIQGKGFFEVELPDGTNAYTRDGEFKLGPSGELLSAQGYPVVTSHPGADFVAEDYDNALAGTPDFDVGIGSSATFIPVGESVHMSTDGTLTTGNGEVVGKLSVVKMTNEDGLIDIGDSLYLAGGDVGRIEEAELGTFLGDTEVKQGFLEQSNVEVVKAMSEILQLNTAIKAEMKIMKTLDTMQENITQTITRNL